MGGTDDKGGPSAFLTKYLGSWPLLVMSERGHGASDCLPSRGSTTAPRQSGAQQLSVHANAALRVWPRYSVLGLAPSLRGETTALLEQIQAGTATHLTRERFQAMKLALYRAVTPGECHASFDRVIVVTQPCRKPLPGHEGTLRRPGQPGIQVLGRPWAPELRQLLGERERVSDRGILGDELGQEVLLLWRARLRPSQHQPRRPVRGQGAVPGLCHHWQEVAASPLPGCPPLRVAQTLRLARHGGRAPRIARLLERSEEPHGIAATRVPAFEEIGCGGREQTAAAVRAALAFRPRGRAQVAKHRMPANLQLLGNGPPGPPLMVEGPALLRARQPPRLTLVCWLLGRARREWGWHGDGHRAVGLRHRHLAEHLMDGFESLVRRVEHVGKGVRKILPEGNAIGDLE
jgi:hypothetical protein